MKHDIVKTRGNPIDDTPVLHLVTGTDNLLYRSAGQVKSHDAPLAEEASFGKEYQVVVRGHAQLRHFIDAEGTRIHYRFYEQSGRSLVLRDFLIEARREEQVAIGRDSR